MRALLSILGYTAGLFALSALAILLTVAVMPPPLDYSDDPSVVTRSDGWPESKAEHMQEGDFWYWVEATFDDAKESTPDTWAGAFFASAMGLDSSAYQARQGGTWLDEFHEFEMFVWCLALPLLTYLVLGAGLTAWCPLPIRAVLVSVAMLGATSLHAFSLTSTELYFLMWDASIHWSNWLGWNYYDFTVRFFIYAPALAIAAGIALAATRAANSYRSERVEDVST